MSLISYNGLINLVREGVISASPENISGASIDITLGDVIMVEQEGGHGRSVDLINKEALPMKEVRLGSQGFLLMPGEFILATSNEVFNLPNNVAAEYKLKSSLARSGLQHMLAGWCDPGWTNSKLTLELYNVSRHTLRITPGMKIGQMVFWECEPVPEGQDYGAKGQYNHQDTVTNNKGVR